MKISSDMGVSQSTQNSLGIKNLYTQKLSKDEEKELRQQVVDNANAFAFKSTNIQQEVFNPTEKFVQDYKDFQNFLKDIGYKGGSIDKLSKEEASKLVSEDGIFGVKQTSQRIADFIISGANANESLLRAGRKGMIQGFKDAEKIWGGKLPEISQQTMAKSIEKVDLAMSDLGFSILDQEV